MAVTWIDEGDYIIRVSDFVFVHGCQPEIMIRIRCIQHEVLIRLVYSQGQEERTRVSYGTGI